VSLAGGCMCGAVRFRVSAAPSRVSHCHCAICRKGSGGVAGTFAAFPSAAVEWQGEAPRVYHSSEFASRRFCGHCGSQLAFAYDARPEETILAVGAFDDAASLKPEYHNFLSAKRWRHPPPDRAEPA